MPRFVILTHDWPFLHWDLMLESGGKLLTWRLLDEPQLDARLRLEKLADHRLKYLDYTGTISGDRGTVDRWDSGPLLSLELLNAQTIAKVQSHRFKKTVTMTIAADSVEFRLELPDDSVSL